MASPRLTARLRSLQQREAEFRSENGTADIRTKTLDYSSDLKNRMRDPDLYRDYISRKAAACEREKDNKSSSISTATSAVTSEQKLSSDCYKSDYCKDYNTSSSSSQKEYNISIRENTSSLIRDKDNNIRSSFSNKNRCSDSKDNVTVSNVSSQNDNKAVISERVRDTSNYKKDLSLSVLEKSSLTKDYSSYSKESISSVGKDSKDTSRGSSYERTIVQRDNSSCLYDKRTNGVHANDEMKGSEEDDEFVGFATLPDQVHRKAVKRGFDFTLMVVGESGLGKSTLINSLFLTDLYKERELPSVQDHVEQTVTIDKKYMEFEERGVKLRLTIVDTPGFSDSVNAEDCWKPVDRYIMNQFNQYYEDESGVNRKNIQDNRVHCCLYFISPYGHGLKQVDIEFMKRLHEKVNIVPVIAKSDTLLPKEMAKIKAKVLEEIEQHKIKIYEFPDCDSDEDEDFKKQDSQLKSSIPFAVIGSNAVVEVNGHRVRGRLYPWGIVEVDNPQHCDFTKLRQMLISTHMQDLKDVTRDVHYENFRAQRVTEQLTKQQLRERNKLKRDSSPSFEAIMDTDKLLEQKDEEIRRMQEMLLKMQQQLGGTKMNGHINIPAS